MLTPLYSYYFKRKRLRLDLRLADVASKTEINISQLSQFENNELKLSNRQIDKLTVFYKCKPLYFSKYSINETYINQCLKKLYFMDFKEEDLSELNKQIEELKNNAYLGYYEIILWCYKALHIQFDDTFITQLQLIESSLPLLPSSVQEFFHVCLLHYYSRINNSDKYSETRNILQTYTHRYWLGLDQIAEIGYSFTNNKISNLQSIIENCKQHFLSISNTNRYNACLMFEAIYLTKIRSYEDALNVWNKLELIYSNTKDNINYYIVLNNKASVHFYKKRYEEAIPLFLQAYEKLKHNTILFNICYSYYAIKDYKNAKKWIDYSDDSINLNDCNNVLIKWIKTMIEAPYSKSCINLLKKTLTTGFLQLEVEKQLFIYQAILDYYLKTKDIVNAEIYISKISELNGDGGYKGK